MAEVQLRDVDSRETGQSVLIENRAYKSSECVRGIGTRPPDHEPANCADIEFTTMPGSPIISTQPYLLPRNDSELER